MKALDYVLLAIIAYFFIKSLHKITTKKCAGHCHSCAGCGFIKTKQYLNTRES